MKTVTALLVAATILGCDYGVDLDSDATDTAAGETGWQLCTGNPDPVCDDLDPCTFDLCNDAHPCGSEYCADADEGPAICWHLPLDLDSDGYATAEGVCAGRGEPWTDCDDSDSTVNPGFGNCP